MKIEQYGSESVPESYNVYWSIQYNGLQAGLAKKRNCNQFVLRIYDPYLIRKSEKVFDHFPAEEEIKKRARYKLIISYNSRCRKLK